MKKQPQARHPPFPHGIRIAGRPVLVSEGLGDPFAAFASLALGGRAYNRWLAAEILDVALRRWSDGPDADTAATDAETGCRRARLAFQEILPAASALGDAAVLAALGVTANLQRTLAILAELLPKPASGRAARAPIRISRHLCGLSEYPAGSPYLPARVAPPIPAQWLRPGLRDLRLVRNALWLPEAEIERCCQDALGELGRRARAEDDLRPLRGAPSLALR